MDGWRNSTLPPRNGFVEKQHIEGYLADKWEMQTEFPDEHPFKYNKPLGKPGLVLSGIPECRDIEVSVTATNRWGSTRIPLIWWYYQLRQRYKLHLLLKLVQLLQDFRQMFLISVVWIVISPFIWLTTSHLISQHKPILYSFQKRVPLPYLLRDFPHQRLITSSQTSKRGWTV